LNRASNNRSGIAKKTSTGDQFVKFSEGPLPDPEALAHYEQILPGLADRIMKLVEKEADGRHATEAATIAMIRDLEGYRLKSERQGLYVYGAVMFSFMATFVIGSYIQPDALVTKGAGWGSFLTLAFAAIPAILNSMRRKAEGLPPPGLPPEKPN
jgi:uncharacterized membrane protein